ncbi:MAG TPA: hypothetical protein VIU12_30110 [Chryseolinea sp.]
MIRILRKRLVIRTITVFFLLEWITNLAAPSVALALTAGPTAPEATSFEPVDTTDMVDLSTGDFNYTIPLLEVPGPAGSYPIVLSHHGNVQTNQDASWVGLTWALSPGAINRYVNGYPDDHRNITNVNRDFWAGGETTIKTVGVSYGIANVATVSAALSFANDTYRGKGVGWQIGVGAGISGTIGLSVTGGQGPYGDTYSSVSVGASAGSMKGSLTLSSNQGFSAQGSYGGSMSGGTIETDGKGIHGDIGGFGISASVYNGKTGRVSEVRHNFQIEVPVYYGFNLRLGRDYRRYWIDETAEAQTFGSLYMADATPGFTSAYDTYDLMDTDLSMAEFSDPEKTLGGSFPEVDQYVVTAQGLSGTIEPKIYRQNLYRQDKKVDDDIQVKSYPLAQTNGGTQPTERADFRFNYDFSNRYEYTPNALNTQGSSLQFDFSNAPVTGATGSDGMVGGRLPGSKHVKWFKNSEIVNGTAVDNGFINTVATGFTREPDEKIGGFSIANTSGVVYHYALPAYSYEEKMRSQNTAMQQETSGLYYNELTKPEPYAYNWFLTAVTGPDYVDRNDNGLADAGDLGYWVNFEYSQWLKDYRWRNPGQGFNTDIDNFDMFSSGKKEIYYLDKITTATHVAVFEKSPRIDGRETSNLQDGGFAPLPYQDPSCTGNCPPVFGPRPTLRLDKIKLYSNVDYQAGNLQASLRSIKFNYDYTLAPGTLNSFTEDNPEDNLGKLTLTSLDFLGKEEVQLIPRMSFEYKNMPYDKDKFDSWGFYKSDYESTGNVNLDRMTTEQSSTDVDAWSLQKINTSLGSTVEVTYESDRYQQPVLNKKNMLAILSLDVNPSDHTFTVKFKKPPVNLQNHQDILAHSEIILMYRRVFKAKEFCICDNGYKSAPTQPMGNYYGTTSLVVDPGKIVSITPDAVKIADEQLYALFTEVLPDGQYGNSPCFTQIGAQFQPQVSYLAPVFVSGNLLYKTDTEIPGGGVRVKQIALRNFGDRQITEYQYQHGVTSYEPVNVGLLFFDFGNWPNTEWIAERERIKEAKVDHSNLIYQNFNKLLSISRALPGPGVMYEKVTVKGKRTDVNGHPAEQRSYMTYTFQTFEGNEVTVNPVRANFNAANGSYDNFGYDQINTKESVLKDFTARIGTVKKVEVFSAAGVLLQKTENHYLHDGLTGQAQQNTLQTNLANQFNSQGLIEQTFSRARIVKYKEGDIIPYPLSPNTVKFASDEQQLLGVVMKKETYPAIQTGQTVTDYKTGISQTTKNLAFDYYSGELTSSQFSDGMGNIFRSTQSPAYTQYPAMGLAAKGGKNMLTQDYQSILYKMNATGDVMEGVLQASRQTWSDQIPIIYPGQNQSATQAGIWRKHQSWAFVGSDNVTLKAGVYPVNDFLSATPESWQLDNEVTLGDVNSHALEGKDVNGKFAATKFTLDNGKPLASATNAAYGEIAYAGAEEVPGSGNQFGGGVIYGGGGFSATAHTGSHSVVGQSGAPAFKYTLVPQKRSYLISVWSSNSNSNIKFKLNSGATQAATVKNLGSSGSWYLLEARIDVPAAGGSLELWCESASQTTLFDDFRFHPFDAPLKSYVYNQWGELSHILDNHNLYTEYRYDAMGRLIETYRETLNGTKKVSEIDYHYAQH